jgi:non-specific serine/threonine protein kinase/serine/threonine-protein kinase
MSSWEELAGLHEKALQQPREDRVRFVVENTTDAALRAEVLSMLEAGELEYLERGLGVDLDYVADPLLGTLAGNCRLEVKLGEGGMGSVYEAVRTLELGAEQRVAVKVWHRAGLSAADVQREAAVLGKLEDPGIARLLDTGITASGQAYLVMELVKGKPLTEYAQGKTLEEKLILSERLCQVVEAAHRALIAHRDIKPSNVLVTEEGALKLIDFGISKSMDDEAKTIEARMTPRYASPEQLLGDSITTATDIYSMGVVMYELLTGRNPFAGLSGITLATAIHEGQVERPNLPTELASIVLKAMARKPEERYESVVALREDLGRYRRREPVAAVEATWGYRARKFVVRQRWALAMAGAVILLVAIGFGKAYWEARNAARRFEQVRGLARSLLFEIHDEVSKVPGTLESRKLIVSRALQYLDQLAQDETADKSLQRDLAESYMKVGTVQGTFVRSNESLEMYADSLGSYRKAVSIFERLQGGAGGDRELRYRLAKALAGVGDACTRLKDKACAATNYRKANGLYELDARQNPGDFMAQARWLDSKITLLDPLLEKQEYGKLRDELRIVAAAHEELGKRHPGEAKLKPYQAYTYKRLGAAEGVLGEYSAGIGWYEKAKEIHRQGKDRTGESTCEVDIAWALERQGKLKEANAALDRAILIRREQALLRRNDPSSKLSLASAIFRKGALLQKEKRWVDASALLEEALTELKPLESGAKQNRQVGEMLAYVLLLKGDSLWETGRRQEAMATYKQGLVFSTQNTTMVKQARRRLGQIGSSEPAKPLQ